MESNEDVESELYKLFLEARDCYLSEVKGRQVRLDSDAYSSAVH